MPSMYSRRCPCSSSFEADAGRTKTTISGWMRKISGKIAIVQTMKPLWRYSRSSLRKIARTRLLLTPSPLARLRVLVDQLEVDALERMLGLADRQHIGAGRHQRPGDGRCGHG